MNKNIEKTLKQNAKNIPLVSKIRSLEQYSLINFERVMIFSAICIEIDKTGYALINVVAGTTTNCYHKERKKVADYFNGFDKGPNYYKAPFKKLLKRSGDKINGTTRPHECYILTVLGKKAWATISECPI